MQRTATTPWTASVFNKLHVYLRREENAQRQFTELLTRDLPDLTPGSPELQLQRHTEGNTLSSAQTHTATHTKHFTYNEGFDCFFPSIHLETDFWHLIWNSGHQSVHVLKLHISLGGFPESGWGLRSESCWGKLKILQKDLQRRWELCSHRSGEFEIVLTSVTECDRLNPLQSSASDVFIFLWNCSDRNLWRKSANLMSWILIGDDLNLADWSSQNRQPLCRVPPTDDGIGFVDVRPFQSQLFHSHFSHRLTRWADRRKLSSPLLSSSTECTTKDAFRDRQGAPFSPFEQIISCPSRWQAASHRSLFLLFSCLQMSDDWMTHLIQVYLAYFQVNTANTAGGFLVHVRR